MTSRTLLGLVFLLLAAASITSSACTTDVDIGETLSTGSSRLVGATTAPVIRVIANEDTVVWFDATGNVFACPKTGCAGPAKVLTTFSGIAAGASGGSVYSESAPRAATIAGGFVYWAGGASLKRCSLSGCVGGGDSVATDALADITRIASGGTYVAWGTSTGVLYVCNAASCVPRRVSAGCDTVADCPTDKPLCLPTHVCVACLNNTTQKVSCKGTTPVCGSDGTCVACDPLVPTGTGAIACTASPNKVCDPKSRACTRCAKNEDCDLGNGRVQTCVNKACAKCDGDFASGSPAACSVTLPICDLATGGCGVCNAADCASGACTQGGCVTTTCTQPTECTATQTCRFGFCVAKLPRGEGCSKAGECKAEACTSARCGRALGAACATDVDCEAGVCGTDKQCGVLPGAACFVEGQCRSGQCISRVCGGPTAPSTQSDTIPGALVVANGRVYFSRQRPDVAALAEIVSCAAAECPAGVTTLLTLPMSSANLLEGDAQSLFFGRAVSLSSTVASLFRCDLPACATPIDMNLETRAPLYIGSDDVFAFDQTSPSLVRCPRSGCAPPVVASLPDPTFAVNRDETLASRPFAFDRTTIYWATSTLFGQPLGNLVVATPR